MTLFQAVRDTIERHSLLEPGDSLVVGVSGGADSLCLLHLLARLRAEFDLALHVAHLNHQLRGERAAADAEFVRRTAVEWGVPVTVSSTDVAILAHERGVGVEEAARQARYAFLAGLAGDTGAGAIAVGHNADDQAETVLMHLLRGAGPAGLRGMSPRLALAGLAPDLPSAAHVTLIRPLLEARRPAIEAYCREYRLQPRFDHSNLDTTLFRNRLRHEVLPVLEAVAPGVGGRLRQFRTEAVRAGFADAWHRRDYETIVQVAEEEDVDIIMLATHGRGGFDRLFVGSVADRVVQFATCPVFLVPIRERRANGNGQ